MFIVTEYAALSRTYVIKIAIMFLSISLSMRFGC